MYSNNKSNFFFTLLVSGLIILTALTLSLSISYETGKYVKSISKDIGVLNSRNSDYKSDIQSMERQIASYELENKELKDRVSSYNKEIQELKKKKYSDSDLALLARLIESESGTQCFEGKLAVGTVVMNRVESGYFPDTIRGVIYQKGQFSPVSNGTINNKPSDDALKAAKEILEGSRVLDSNVLYFYNPKLVGKNWIKSRKITKQIDDHAFAI